MAIVIPMAATRTSAMADRMIAFRFVLARFAPAGVAALAFLTVKEISFLWNLRSLYEYLAASRRESSAILAEAWR